jgi:catalase (peroxidase I)
MTQEFEFELMQDGLRVASSWGPDRDRVWADILHYAMMYSQDGPVAIYEVTRVKERKKRAPVPVPQLVSTGWDSQSCFRVGG